MGQTYTDVWRAVKLHVSAAPTFLVREWVNEAWKTLARRRPTWVFLRAQAALTIQASRALTIGVTQGSPTITSTGAFVAGDVGRQLRVSSYPFYTITVVTDVNTVTIDRAYGEDTSATASGSIFDGYTVMPADFGQFDLIADPYNQRRLAFWISQEELNLLDPIRAAGESGPRLLATAMPSTAPSTLGRIQSELWPRPSTARSYPYYYFKQASNLAEGFVFSGVLADGGDVLQKGALAQAARWPGTSDKPNPYFNLGLGDRLQREFEDGIQHLSLRDDDQQGSDYQRVHWDRWPLADLAYNDSSLRSSDATVNDLF